MFDALGEKLQASITPTQPLVIRADSVEEAVAFTVAVVMASGDLQHHALVVTEPHGWRYVEANPQLRVAIAARTETASTLVLREDLQVIIPHATGDLACRPNGNELILERPNIYEFEKALIATGMEESDAKRYALSTGRSWTVFRRQRSTNPAIQRPAWLEAPQAASLPLFCLLGAWHSDKAADRQAVEELSGRSYETVEQDLRQLVRLDDAPLLKIGAVWKPNRLWSCSVNVQTELPVTNWTVSLPLLRKCYRHQTPSWNCRITSAGWPSFMEKFIRIQAYYLNRFAIRS